MAHIKLEYKSQALLRGVTVDVILPSDAIGLGLETETPRPYKTLYFLPGYSADSEEIITYLGMRKQAELKAEDINPSRMESILYSGVAVTDNGNLMSFAKLKEQFKSKRLSRARINGILGGTRDC